MTWHPTLLYWLCLRYGSKWYVFSFKNAWFLPLRLLFGLHVGLYVLWIITIFTGESKPQTKRRHFRAMNCFNNQSNRPKVSQNRYLLGKKGCTNDKCFVITKIVFTNVWILVFTLYYQYDNIFYKGCQYFWRALYLLCFKHKTIENLHKPIKIFIKNKNQRMDKNRV